MTKALKVVLFCTHSYAKIQTVIIVNYLLRQNTNAIKSFLRTDMSVRAPDVAVILQLKTMKFFKH